MKGIMRDVIKSETDLGDDADAQTEARRVREEDVGER